MSTQASAMAEHHIPAENVEEAQVLLQSAISKSGFRYQAIFLTSCDLKAASSFVTRNTYTLLMA